MNELTNLMQTKGPFPVYPVTQTVYAPGAKWPARVQVALSAKRVYLLLAHPEGHWCAYALIQKADLHWIRTSRFVNDKFTISYLGASTNQICWMDRTNKAELKHPVQISDPHANPDGDYWVGTHFNTADPTDYFDLWQEEVEHWLQS